jgi:XTP/dITP diphosphohydrolase
VFLASRNAKKLIEMQRILAEHIDGVEVVGLGDVADYAEPIEDQPTFEGNAMLKARAGFAATGLPTIADDSGLCVSALNAMPGVLSARWSGSPGADKTAADERNNELLLAQLGDIPDERRDAYFECAVAFVGPAGSRSWSTAGCRVGSSVRRGAPGASATTWCSSRTSMRSWV